MPYPSPHENEGAWLGFLGCMTVILCCGAIDLLALVGIWQLIKFLLNI